MPRADAGRGRRAQVLPRQPGCVGRDGGDVDPRTGFPEYAAASTLRRADGVRPAEVHRRRAAPDRVFVKPNFVSPDPGVGDGQGGYAVLSVVWRRERAWRRSSQRGSVSRGDEVEGARRRAAGGRRPRLPGVEWLGRRPLSEVYDVIGAASVLVMPSVWYEGLPKTLIESFAKGTPSSRQSWGRAEAVTHGKTACTSRRATRKICQAAEVGRRNPASLAAIRTNCRQTFERRYTADEITACDRHLPARDRAGRRNNCSEPSMSPVS